MENNQDNHFIYSVYYLISHTITIEDFLIMIAIGISTMDSELYDEIYDQILEEY